MGTVTIKPLSIADQYLSASVAVIHSKLDRIRTYIIKTYIVNGKLDAEHQHAVRVIDSRSRLLKRLLLLRIRPETSDEYKAAAVEMKMARQDSGDIFLWVLKNHAYGRLGCSGCEYDYKQVPGIAFPVKVILSKECPQCQKGVMHSQLVESQDELCGVLEGFRAVTGISCIQNPPARQKSIMQDAEGILMACEHCGYWEISPC